MKRIIQKLGTIVVLLLSFHPASAYDFEADGIYYNVLSLGDLTCEVTYNAENKNWQSLSFSRIDIYNKIHTLWLSETYPSYKGDITIPETVNYKGRTLKVIGIGEYAFLNCRELTSLSLPSSIKNISEVLVDNYYIGAFDYCNIQTLSAGNYYILEMFDRSYADITGYKTQDNLKNLVLANDYYGRIDVNYSQYNLKLLKSLASIVPVFDPHLKTPFSNKQILEMEVLVPEDKFHAYQSADVWKDFWELKAMKSLRSITLNETSLSLEPKQNFQLSAYLTPDDAYDSSVTWSSSNPSVATVSENGLVNAVTKGDAQIIVFANDGSGVHAECSIHVDLLVKNIQLSNAEIAMEQGNSKQLNVIISPKDAFVQDVAWSSDDENIAAVDNQGNVIAHGVGVTNINATTTDGSNLTATCKVTVANLVKSIIVTPDTLTIKEGETSQLYATVAPENATYKEVIWTSENLDVASVDASGKVTAVSSGTTLIKATSTDGSGVYGQCEITVTAETVEYNGVRYQRNSLTTLKIIPNNEYPYSGDFFIPETAKFNGYEMTVTEIGDEAFANCGDLTSIVIPNTIAKIGESAFNGCDQLKYIKIGDGSPIEVNLDVVFSDSPISELYIGSNNVSYNPDSRLLTTVKSMTLGGNVTNLPPKEAFKTLNSFIVKEGESPIVETEDYLSSSVKLINQQEISNPNTMIYYRKYYLVTYQHLSPMLNALQNSTLNYLHIRRNIQEIEVDKSKTYEQIPTTANSRYQEWGYKDEIHYQYEDLIVKSAYCRKPVLAMAINENVVELNIEESVKLTVTCTPEDASLTAVEWSSSDENIAIVDIFGNVTKLADGEAIISAVATDGSNQIATCKIVNPSSGLENVEMSAGAGVYTVYNLQGMLVMRTENCEEIQQLPSGIYLVNGKKVIIR